MEIINIDNKEFTKTEYGELFDTEKGTIEFYICGGSVEIKSFFIE